MKKSLLRVNKIFAIAIIFFALQTLQANTTFAELPIKNTYIPVLNWTVKSNDLAEPFTPIPDDGKIKFAVIEKTLTALAQKQTAIYNEYLSLTDNGRKVPESLQEIYVKKMRKTSRNLIACLRETLSLCAGKGKESFVFTSQDGRAFRAVFLLDKNSIILR